MLDETARLARVHLKVAVEDAGRVADDSTVPLVEGEGDGAARIEHLLQSGRLGLGDVVVHVLSDEPHVDVSQEGSDELSRVQNVPTLGEEDEKHVVCVQEHLEVLPVSQGVQGKPL